jgi:glycosyltransferase involved in cell wall biosynthesis
MYTSLIIPYKRHIVIQLKVVYAHEGESVYDRFFLTRLSKIFDTVFLTFNRNPIAVADYEKTVMMPDFGRPLPVREGIRAILSIPMRVPILRSYLNRLHPDILIGNWIWRYGLYSALSGFKPFILFIWGSDAVIIPKISILLRGIASYVIKKADLTLVDSDIQFEACLKLGAKREQVLKLPWFDVNEVTAIAKNFGDKRKIRKELGIGDKDFVIICTRRHEKIYDVETLVRAAPSILSKIKNARFLLVGGGKLTGSLKKLVRELKLDKRFIFLGQQQRENVVKYLKASDVYVSTSLSDGTSAALLEAMSCKIIPVVTSISGNREWITDGENGLLFPTKNSELLAGAVIKTLTSKDLSDQMAENAFGTVVSRADWTKNSGFLEEAIISLKK